MMMTSRFSALSAATVLGLTISAGAGSASAPPTSEPAATATAEATLPPTDTAAAGTWEKVVPGGDCACADASEFNFWVRDADPSRVVLFLEGGGACFDATTCAFTNTGSTTYDWNISPDDDPAVKRGIVDLDNAENPFAGDSIVYVPYCTGDIHLGNKISEYSPELTVNHVGFVNGLAALDHLRHAFPAATEVVVVGESAGAIAAPLYGGIVSDLLPDAHVTVFSDGSGGYPIDQDGSVFDALWGSFANLPDWDVNEGVTASDLSAPQFWIQAGLHDPSMTMSRFDFAYDAVQTAFMQLTGADTSDVGATMIANEQAIEAVGVVQHSFTAPGDSHTLVLSDGFYEMEVDGVRLVDWVTDVVAGEDVPDVACTECGNPSAPATTG
jgi:hypothetical protein